MEKLYIIILIGIINISCSQKNNFITNKGVGNLILNQKPIATYNKKDFDITFDEHQKIKSIIIHSEKYKTKTGFGVGSKLGEIKNYYKNSIEKPLSLSKGNATIGNLGKGILIENIFFVDNNQDGRVNFVWLQEISSN